MDIIVLMSRQILLDTNILVHLIRKDRIGEALSEYFSIRTAGTKNAICVVTIGEIKSLSYQLNWGVGKTTAAQDILLELVKISIDNPSIYEAYAQIDTHCRKNGISVGKNDLWIAATAVATGYDLLTLDNDFDPLDGVFLNVLKPA